MIENTRGIAGAAAGKRVPPQAEAYFVPPRQDYAAES
jgi:hypothetical protein